MIDSVVIHTSCIAFAPLKQDWQAHILKVVPSIEVKEHRAQKLFQHTMQVTTTEQFQNMEVEREAKEGGHQKHQIVILVMINLVKCNHQESRKKLDLSVLLVIKVCDLKV